MTSNRMHDLNLLIEPHRIVNSKRFMDAELLKESKKRIAFNNKAELQMLTQASRLMAEAKALHTQLESYYVLATDFAKVDALTQEIIARIGRLTVGTANQ
jgi:H2-forming N5,N10-methylenetetrahydromethanopterin dehydrogenase-like enzyme